MVFMPVYTLFVYVVIPLWSNWNIDKNIYLYLFSSHLNIFNVA